MTHIEAQALVATCMDLRFQEFIDRWLKENNLYGKHDRVAFAGAAGNLDILMGQLELSVKLHNTKEVYVLNHENCGYYGNTVTAGSDEELKKHTEDLRKAKEEIEKKFSGLIFHGLFVKLDGNIVEII